MESKKLPRNAKLFHEHRYTQGEREGLGGGGVRSENRVIKMQ
jgi:hypothetical protein